MSTELTTPLRGSHVLRRISAADVAELLPPVGRIAQADLDEMAVPTYLHANPMIRWLFWRRHSRVLDLAELHGNEAVLDFGTGIGALLPSLCVAAREVHATDLRDELARALAARRKLPVQFHPADRLDESLRDDSLDVIVAADVLEHIENPDLEALLAMFARKLRKGGRLVISLPTENILYRLGRIVAGYAEKGGYHRTRLQELLSTFERSGLQPVRRCSVPAPGPVCLFLIASYRRA